MKKAVNWILTSDYGYLVLVLIMVIVINIFLEFHFVSGDSMNNTLKNKDVVVAEKVSVWTQNINRGDIIIAIPNNSPKMVIKRVIGIPGDTISYQDGKFTVNGTVLDESYILDDPSQRQPRIVQQITLGKDEYFIAGDNRNNSDDSIHYGPVNISNIKGKVLIHFGL